MIITPVIQSQPDWKVLNPFFGGLSGKVDQLGIPIQDPGALPTVLKPLYDWHLQSCQRLITLTFLFQIENTFYGFLALGNFTTVIFNQRQWRSDHVFVTGTLDQWVQAILLGCTPTVDWTTRAIANELEIIFRKSVVADAWKNRQLVAYTDGTNVWQQ